MDKTIGIITIYPPQATLHGSGASGVGSYTKNLLTNMSKKQRSDTVVICNRDDDFSTYKEDGMIIERSWQRKGLFSWMKDIMQSLRKYPHIETIHIHHEFNMFGSLLTIPVFLLLLWRLRKYKTIVTYHGVVDTHIIDKKYGEINSLPSYFPPLFLRFAFTFFYRASKFLVDVAIVHEQYFKDVLMRYGYKNTQVEVIYHGVEDRELGLSQKDARKELTISSDKKVLLYFGFLAGYKGVDLLLDAFAMMDPDKYHLILAGGAPKRTLANPDFKKWYDSVDQRAKDIKGVTRVGFVPDEDIQTIYAATDVLVIPYLYMLAASGPMALALTYNKPFLVSDAFAPVITEEGMTFARDSESLKQRLESFFSDMNNIQSTVSAMRSERLWKEISKQTALLYR